MTALGLATTIQAIVGFGREWAPERSDQIPRRKANGDHTTVPQCDGCGTPCW